MLTFLHGPSILESAKQLIADGEGISLAVAYWGKGALDKLGIKGEKPVRIICDLLSVGCNPYEIEKLFKAPFSLTVEVRHFAGLHSKVYSTKACVIVGSANASSNGMGFDKGIQNVEAALQTDDPNVLRSVVTWFDDTWDGAQSVDRNLIKKSKEIRRPANSTSFLAELIENPSRFDRVSLIYVDEEPTKKAKAAFWTIAKNHYPDAESKNWDDGDEPFYQADESKEVFDRTYKPGDYAINCCDEMTSVSSIKEPGSIKIAKDDCIVLLNDDLKEVMQLPFPKKERKALYRAVKQYLKPYESDKRRFREEKDKFGTLVKNIKPELLELIRVEARKIGL